MEFNSKKAHKRVDITTVDNNTEQNNTKERSDLIRSCFARAKTLPSLYLLSIVLPVFLNLKYDHHDNNDGRSRKIMMTTFLPLLKAIMDAGDKTKTKRKKTKVVSLRFIAPPGVAQLKAI